MESYSQMQRMISIGQTLISRKIIDEFVMVDKFFSSGVSAETILQESLEEVKSTLSKLDMAVDRVKLYP